MLDIEGGTVRSRCMLDHWRADEVSIIFGAGTHSAFPFSVEIAFFKDDEWVTEVLPEFREYVRQGPSQYTIYEYVPINRIGMFIYLYGVK